MIQLLFFKKQQEQDTDSPIVQYTTLSIASKCGITAVQYAITPVYLYICIILSLFSPIVALVPQMS